ncbi:NAD(P)-dependent oxidoreductase [Bacillus sp. NTK071]|uniref:NAD-dependent epimerase/dehydratase family protein n=1 Tax=Bacillus sp. NTK071 TaxID=2802175 RepID=UPI001A8C4756|nr:NAD(P)-dependent oxidoreductase [Bacillus sp. NTK071]MBN8207211.1 NAD(P)-dependent oxidoreductase [Bacillus sp. NTK071]
MKKVMITGALGFIGFHLTELLLNQGIKVVAIDGRVDPARTSEYKLKEMSFLRNSNYKQVDSLLQDASLETEVEGCDTVFHLASPYGQKRASQMIQEGISNTKKVLEVCEGKVLVYLSSIEVFGKRYGNITERTPINPVTSDGRVKAQEEAILATTNRNTTVKTIRVPLVYGPWQPVDCVFQDFFINGTLMKAFEAEGEKYHFDSLYVEDVCQAMYQTAMRKEGSETINLSSGREGEWQNGVEWCIGEQLDRKKNLRCAISNKDCASKLRFTNLTPIHKGLERQRDHVEKMMLIDPAIYLG